MTLQSVGIVGLGLIGGSMGLALRGKGILVRGLDVSPAHRQIARNLGIVDEAVETLTELTRQVDVVILAVPVKAILQLLPQVARAAPSDALILDTGSVKAPVSRMMATLPGSGRCAGGHPIAGRERSGPDAADADLFRGRAFVLTPHVGSEPRFVERARQLVETLGALPILLDASRHDDIVSRTSHLPQLLSTALALSLVPADLQLSGSGLKDMTRLARSDPGMWRDILVLNRANVVPAIRQYITLLEGFLQSIELGEASKIEARLRDAAHACHCVTSGATS